MDAVKLERNLDALNAKTLQNLYKFPQGGNGMNVIPCKIVLPAVHSAGKPQENVQVLQVKTMRDDNREVWDMASLTLR